MEQIDTTLGKPLSEAVHFDLDGVWAGNAIVTQRLDLSVWGPKLRFSAPRRVIEEFYHEIQPQLPSFLLYGSGDFHHLTALWVRRLTEPFVLVSFDNHPDWDVRPPKWACGAWVNRALELRRVQQVTVWGCGNFECWWPGRFFGNRRAERQGRLEVHPWADDRRPADQHRRGAILRSNWQNYFRNFVDKLKGSSVYITIDLDCLTLSEAVTNWENGRFTTEDLGWALERLHNSCRVVGGDLCGGYSEPNYARRTQRFAADFDHPKLVRPSADEIRRTNFSTLAKLWPLLVG